QRRRAGPFGKGLLRRGDGLAHLVRARKGKRARLFARRRVEDGGGAAAAAGNAATADEMGNVGRHGRSSQKTRTGASDRLNAPLIVSRDLHINGRYCGSDVRKL